MIESVLEHIRSTECAESPSRLSSAFFFNTKEQADTYANIQKLHFYNLYEVELTIPKAAVAEADHRRVQPMGALGFDWARAYWRGDPLPLTENEHFYRECFTESDLRVLRRVPQSYE